MSLEPLAGAVRESGGLLADAVADPPYPPADLGAQIARAPRAVGSEADYLLLVEAIREGYELHYGSPRVVTPADPDLALLAGDQLYALGLARLAALGDLEAVTVLADVISDCARAHAEDAPDRARDAWNKAAAKLAQERTSTGQPAEPNR